MKKIGYDIDEKTLPPKPGNFICSIGKNETINSIYHIVSIRKVNSLKNPFRYKMEVLPADDMKPFAIFSPNSGIVTIRGKQEYSLVWYSRKKKDMSNADKLKACAFEIQNILSDKFGEVPAFVIVMQPPDKTRVEYLANCKRTEGIKILRDTAIAMEGALN